MNCSQNILIDICDNGRIGDFGFSLELPEIVEGRSMFTAQAFARMEGYYPSELSVGHFSTKSDVYCYGVVIHTVLCVFVLLISTTILLIRRTGNLYWQEGIFC